MTHISIDDGRRLGELELSEHFAVCDKTGRVLGHYLPAPLYNRLVCESVSARVSTEELRKRMAEPGGSSLAEIWERLERL